MECNSRRCSVYRTAYEDVWFVCVYGLHFPRWFEGRMILRWVRGYAEFTGDLG